MPLPLAYYLTWTTYGTRLHGDTRGSVDLEHNVPGTPILEPDAAREADDRSRMSDPPFDLNSDSRSIVDQVIRDHCRIRKWTLLALNVRTNHVHVVVNCHGSHTPEIALAQFKSWGTRRLVERGLAAHGQKLWTDHGSTRWINHEAGLVEAIDYVLNRQ